jgi:hypothetical protein
LWIFIAELVTGYSAASSCLIHIKSEVTAVLNVAHYYTELQLMHLSHLGTLHKAEEVAMSVRESLLMQHPDPYCGEVFKFVQICANASVYSETPLKYDDDDDDNNNNNNNKFGKLRMTSRPRMQFL